MAKLATPEHEHDHVGRVDADGVYAALVAVWIVAVWFVALYVAADAASDASAGVGGDSFLFGCSLATAGIVTACSGSFGPPTTVGAALGLTTEMYLERLGRRT
jgi:hypothetical protein